MRVLMISAQYPPDQGGGGTHTFYLASELAKLGCSVHVLAQQAINRPAEQRVRPNLFVHRAEFGSKATMSSAEALRQAMRICSNTRPDVIHGQHLQGANVAIRLKAGFNIPTVITLHKTPKLSPVDQYLTTDPIYSEIRFLTRGGLCDHFVAGSRVFQRELLDIGAGLIQPDRVRLIYHGVPYRWLRERAYHDISTPADISLTLSADEKLILCPARLDRRKNLAVLVSAAARLVANSPSTKFKFLVTGTPLDREEERYKEELIAQARCHGIEDLFIFRAFDFNVLPAVFRFADACVLPTYKEGLGLVLLEAMALGVPIICTRTIGIDEIIHNNGEGALLFDAGEDEELFQHLYKVCFDTEVSRRLKKQGIKIVRERFSASRMAHEHVVLYNSLCDRISNPSSTSDVVVK